jgi:ribonuclease P protein component
VGLRRTQRLTQRREIAAVYRKGRPQRGELVAVRALKTGLPVSRFGFAVGGSVGNAVVRNLVRRRLREIVASVGVAPGWDLMLSARPGAAKASFQELRRAAREALRRAGVLEGQMKE